MYVLLTYLIGHKRQPIIPGASASCAPTPVSHISLSSSATSTDPRIKYTSRRCSLLYSNDLDEPAQSLDVDTVHNFYVVEELIQLTVESDTEIIANSHWTEGLFSRILSRLLHHCLIGSMPLRSKEARLQWVFYRVLVFSYEKGLCYSIAY